MKNDTIRDSFGRMLALSARLQQAAARCSFPTDLLDECRAWHIGEKDESPKKQTPARGGRARAGKR